MNAEDYLARVRSGLEAVGYPDADLDAGRLTVSDLAPVDQFHVRGLQAIEDLVTSSGFGPDDRVVDIGCGTGGPARALVAATGARVTGYDLNELSVEAGNRMSEWTGLSDRVDLHVGDATALPAGDETFDGAWSVHVGMFVADKASLYAEAYRVLKPGGRLAIYDPVVAGGKDHAYPVPWAADRSDNHASSVDELTARLIETGFVDVSVTDRTGEARDWFAAQRAAREKAAADGAQAGPPPLGLHLLVGPCFGEMSANAAKALAGGMIGFAELHARKPG